MKNEYRVIGAIKFVSYEEYSKLGYLADIVSHPVLEYESLGNPGTTYWKHGSLTIKPHYMVVYNYMVEKRMNIEEAQLEYPELFL